MMEDDSNKRLGMMATTCLDGKFDLKTTHKCSSSCLGPLTFHPRVVGDMICLSEGDRRAERFEETFNGGVVFTSRPVRIHERIRLLVEKRVPHWQGAMRVGFTNICPSARSLPLPQFSMPNLTQTSGHWAIIVPESCCQETSVLEFWVTDDGHICLKFQNSEKKKVEAKVDVRKPLWAMIDVYGQTCSVFLLDDRCVVCMTREADITLPCGHRCLCLSCTSRVLVHFGTCPLCRVRIDTGVMFEGSMISRTGDS